MLRHRGHLNLVLETAAPTPEYPLEELTEGKLQPFFKFFGRASPSPPPTEPEDDAPEGEQGARGGHDMGKGQVPGPAQHVPRHP